MVKNKPKQLTKKDISKEIHSKIGLSNIYISTITDDILESLKSLIKQETTKISNFGTFRLLNKSQRIGRNPKTKEPFEISARKSASFICSKNLDKKINNL
tara:strand:- start:568 stop:867 length:300 start_codon:yes stop_codon:yes gene_type:complete